MKAQVRFYGVVGPRCNAQRYWWADISHNYASSLQFMGLRFLSIGGAQFPLMQGVKGWKHWQSLAGAFTAELGEAYVNVVCAPPGLPLGRAVSGRQFAPARVVGCQGGEVDPRVLAQGRAATGDDIYQPESALHGLLTVGVRNIAITSGYRVAADNSLEEIELDSREVTALKQYDAILTPWEDDAARLVELGLDARHCSAERIGRDDSLIPFLADIFYS